MFWHESCCSSDRWGVSMGHALQVFLEQGKCVNISSRLSHVAGLGLLATWSFSAQAVSVSCGGDGNRTVTVDPALSGGLCHSQTGNLQNADIEALGFTLVEKDVIPGGDDDGLLTLYADDRSSGTWGVSEDAWRQL